MPEEAERKLPVIACPICKKPICRYSLLSHVKNVHKDVDPDDYRAKAKQSSSGNPEEKKANRQKFLSKVDKVMHKQ